MADAVNDPNSTLGDFKYPTTTKTATTVDYKYDGNGNMISDQNKKITGITYNILNLPSQITVAGKGAIKYYYDAAGNKLQKRTIDNTASPSKTTVTTYVGGAVYLNDTLQFFGTEEGRIRANTAKTAWIYDYLLKDHLGNTRMMITDDYEVSSPILEAYSYYPFGLQQKGIGLQQASIALRNKYNYNGIEFDDDLFINLDRAFYRFHDPQVGRFLQIDPKIESADGWSPYTAMLDNPVFNIDPLGDSSLPWQTRLWGGVKALGGVAEMAIGATAGLASSWTGVGAVAAGQRWLTALMSQHQG